MTMTELLKQAEYLLQSWQRGADYEHYHMDVCEVLENMSKHFGVEE